MNGADEAGGRTEDRKIGRSEEGTVYRMMKKARGDPRGAKEQLVSRFYETS
jgi:hypothetical protein